MEVGNAIAKGMVMNMIRKPILVGGLGVSLLLWLGGSTYGFLMEDGSDILMSLMLLGGGLWWLRGKGKTSPKTVIKPTPQTITIAAVEKAIAQTQATLNQLETEDSSNVASFTAQLATLTATPSASQLLQGQIIGTAGVGKTSLSNYLEQTSSPIAWQENSVDAITVETDLLLWLISGDLTASELAQLQTLRHNAHHILLLLTKQDQQPSQDRDALIQLVQDRVQDWVLPENVIAIAAAPQPIRVRRHQADGQMVESTTTPEPQLAALDARLGNLVQPDAIAALHRATQWRRLRQLKTAIRDQLNQVRRDRARPIVEQYQWLAAGTAIANPVAALDLVATVAINAQMMLDLAQIYRCQLSLDQAQVAVREVGELLVKLGAVELSTQTLAHLGKSTPLTYLAGGAIQGVSAAYLTRIVGLSLVDYFAEQDPLQPPSTTLNFSRLGDIMGKWLQQTRRTEMLTALWQQLPTRVPVTPDSGAIASGT